MIWNLPSKANAARRHHIPKQKRKLTNLRAYDASLRQRGSLTVWFTDEAITAWQAGDPLDLPDKIALGRKSVMSVTVDEVQRQERGALLGEYLIPTGILQIPPYVAISA
ncbi:MAG: hypothetical protein QOG73_1533, partial [Acetobacteraceae bacterium]|nr:hypothetical protein [Acetobacteraceae bacterium]